MTPEDVWETSDLTQWSMRDFDLFKAFYTFLDERLQPLIGRKLVFPTYDQIIALQFGKYPYEFAPVGDALTLTGGSLGPDGKPTFSDGKTWTPFLYSWSTILSNIFELSKVYINTANFNTEKGEFPSAPYWWSEKGFPTVDRESDWKKPFDWLYCNFRRIKKRVITTLTPEPDILHPFVVGSKAICFPEFGSNDLKEIARIEYIRGKIFVYDGKAWNLDLTQTDPDYLHELGLPHVEDIVGPWILEDIRLAIKQLKTVIYFADSVRYRTYFENYDFSNPIQHREIEWRIKPFAAGFQPEILHEAPFSGLGAHENPNANIFSFSQMVASSGIGRLGREHTEGTLRWMKDNLLIRGGTAKIYLKFIATSTNEAEFPVDDKYRLYKSEFIDQNESFDINPTFFEPWIFEYPLDPENYFIISDEGNLLIQRHWAVNGAYALYDWNFKWR